MKVLSTFTPAVEVSSTGAITCNWFNCITSVVDEVDPWDDLDLNLGQGAADVLDARLEATRGALEGAVATLARFDAFHAADSDLVGQEAAEALRRLADLVRPFFAKVEG